MQEQRGGLGRGIQWPRMKGSGRRRSKDLAKIPGFILRTMGRHGEGFPKQGSISIRLTPYCVPYKSGWRRLWREAEVQVQGLPQGSGMQADEGGRAGAGGFGVPFGKRWQRLTAGPGTIRSASQGRTHFSHTSTPSAETGPICGEPEPRKATCPASGGRATCPAVTPNSRDHAPTHSVERAAENSRRGNPCPRRTRVAAPAARA